MSRIRISNKNKIEANMINVGDNNINIYNSSEFDEIKLQSLIEMISENIKDIELKEQEKKTIDILLQNISDELKKEKKDNQLIKKSINTVKNILEGITGSLIASGIVYELGKLFK
ncbi:hypothetical protein [Clostridium sp. JS66]|uniref:hypothetical protein n=1 Tax=Clostridium sp. JS66 TaxID=3064705 RepID=UPI00298EBA7E|nr:hypothetical protein [Clostridium sp. JS66]WPC42845.1 hypothetical protein Q6H37_05070 [Clostridium sp. JS66]